MSEYVICVTCLTAGPVDENGECPECAAGTTLEDGSEEQETEFCLGCGDSFVATEELGDGYCDAPSCQRIAWREYEADNDDGLRRHGIDD